MRNSSSLKMVPSVSLYFVRSFESSLRPMVGLLLLSDVAAFHMLGVLICPATGHLIMCRHGEDTLRNVGKHLLLFGGGRKYIGRRGLFQLALSPGVPASFPLPTYM